MIFKPELAKAIVEGRKTVTRRVVREDNPRSPWHPDRALKLVGKRVAIQDGRGKPAIATARVVSVTREPEFIPCLIHPREAFREGCFGPTRFKELWLQLHGNPFRPYDVWRIELADVEPLKAPA